MQDELVVFSESAQRVFRLNATAAFIWKKCEQRTTESAIARAIARDYDVPLTTARRDVAAAVSGWKRLGLLADGVSPFDGVAAAKPMRPKTRVHHHPSVGGSAVERMYRLLDITVRIRFACPAAEQLAHPTIAHLETRTPASPDRRLDVVPIRGGYRVFRDGELVSRFASRAELTPFLHSHLLMTAYRDTSFLMAIHAAAVGRGNECVVMPAPSGSGKSTLTAALIRSGLDYLTDEVVLLKDETRNIAALPVSLSLKQPSWKPLESLYRGLHALPIHRRRDGKNVRYLPPPRGAAHSSCQSSRTRAIVFPRYGTDEPWCDMAALSAAEALQRITLAGYDVAGGRLDAGLVGTIVDWIRDLDCYELRYRGWPQAVRHVKELLA